MPSHPTNLDPTEQGERLEARSTRPIWARVLAAVARRDPYKAALLIRSGAFGTALITPSDVRPELLALLRRRDPECISSFLGRLERSMAGQVGVVVEISDAETGEVQHRESAVVQAKAPLARRTLRRPRLALPRRRATCARPRARRAARRGATRGAPDGGSDPGSSEPGDPAGHLAIAGVPR